MTRMLIDSHCHLEFPDLASDADSVMARAEEAGVRLCVTIGTRLSTFPNTLAVAERYQNVWCSVGIHPHDASNEPLESSEPLVARAAGSKVVGIGETGLDYYYQHSPRDAQIANFRFHVEAARQTGLPLIVHTRDAEEDTISILREEMGKGRFTGILHCFTGSAALAGAALELGFLISASGIITFRKSEELRRVFQDIPLDRLLVETDAPYLAPVPHRGKRNEPAFVAHTAKALAELKGISQELLAANTTANFFRLFTKVPNTV